MKNSLYLFFAFLLAFAGFTSCDDKDEEVKVYDLTFEKDTYSVMNGLSSHIPIRSGNGDYTITAEDKEIVTVSYSSPVEAGFGYFSVIGHKKGTTVVAVKDNVTNQEEKLTFTVIEAYLTFTVFRSNPVASIINAENKAEIEKDIADNASLKTSYMFSLVKNDEKTLYLFKDGEDMTKGKVLYKGTYEFKDVEDVPYLFLHYKNNETVEEYHYNLSLSDNRTLSLLSYFFELGWYNTRSEVMVPTISLIEDLTDRYEPTYPKLETATLESMATITTSLNGELPVELFE